MHKKEQGLSLVELLLAVAILLIGLIPLVRVLMYGLETANRANKITVATNLARDIAEEIRSQAFSEEFVIGSPTCTVDDASPDSTWRYPSVDTTAQCVGREGSGEAETLTLTDGGRIKVFDDVDDYDGWCRGIGCSDPSKALETYDGHAYEGAAYYGFTRQVRVGNVDTAVTYVTEFSADPYPLYTSPTNVQTIRRYNMDVYDSWTTLTGLTALKRIEVTVTYERFGSAGKVEVVDINYAVMPEI